MTGKAYKMYMYGTRGTHSVFGNEYKEFGGQTSCVIIKRNDYALIVDCGSGLYCAKKLLSNCKKIDVLISHVHYDHIIGLLDNTVVPKGARVNFYGNFNKWSKGSIFKDFMKRPFWPINTIKGKVNNINADGREYKLSKSISLKAYPSNHGDDTCILVLFLNGKKVCFLSDCSDIGKIDMSIIKDADYMLYDGTFDYKDSLKYRTWGHSSWNKGVKLAKEANVSKLIITHHNPNYNDNKLRKMEKECKKEFKNSVFARMFDVFKI